MIRYKIAILLYKAEGERRPQTHLEEAGEDLSIALEEKSQGLVGVPS
jgi:hypothetical protein